ncbi:MAG: leucine-rich repeat protein [Oscillospiraceae bacterium]|nr:leucine-rich repeat protein [Oscillospiraceae bacterium]
MFCPNCGISCEEDQRFCMYCGTDLHPNAESVTVAPPPTKKGSLWVPILILIVLSAIGIGIFFATAGWNRTSVQADMPWFSLRDGELSFDATLYIGGNEITVPTEINSEPVLRLADGCFAGCEEITTVYLPDSLESIGHFAFEGCIALRGIYIPDSVSYIGEAAFYDCTALEAISIPYRIRYIDLDAFDNCDKLYYIFYPGTIDEWTLVYDEFINPYTGVYCQGGSFYQGGDPYG